MLAEKLNAVCRCKYDKHICAATREQQQQLRENNGTLHYRHEEKH